MYTLYHALRELGLVDHTAPFCDDFSCSRWVDEFFDAEVVCSPYGVH